MDAIKNLLGLLPAVLPLIEKYIDWLPVNPLIRERLWLAGTVAAGLAGLVGYASAKQLSRGRLIVMWIGLICFVIALAILLGITESGLTFSLSPEGIAWLERLGYVLIFLFLGLAIGGVLGLL
jgi:hypothetical protein